MIAGMCLTAQAVAGYAWYDGLYFYYYDNISLGNTAEVEFAPDSSYLNLTGVVTVPEFITVVQTVNGESQEVVYPVRSVRSSAFKNCTGITEVILPEAVSYIGPSAFAGCTAMTRITIPKKLSTIAGNAYDGCTAINTVIYNAENLSTAYGIWPNDGVTEVTINEGVRVLPRNIFKGAKMTSVTLPQSLRYIGESSLAYCSELTEIVVPDSVTKIGYGAFQYDTSLTDLTIGYLVDTIGNSAVVGSNNIKNLTWKPRRVLWNGGVNRSSIEHVTLGDRVEYLDRGIVNGTSVTELTIPASVKVITEGAVQQCKRLKTVSFNEGLDSICNEAFSSCDSLLSFTLPNTLVHIGSYAFSYCRQLQSVVLPSSLKSIDAWAFNYCLGLKDIYFPRSVERIDSCIISYTPMLASIVVEDGNPYYNSGQNCHALIETATGVLIGGCYNTVIPNTVRKIGPWSFHHAVRLKEANIPEGVRVIGQSAFRECWGITKVTLPSTMDSIAELAFYYTTDIDTVICYAVNPPTLHDPHAFDVFWYNAEAKLFVPAQSVQAYKTTDDWTQFKYVFPIECIGHFGDVNRNGVTNISDVIALIQALTNSDEVEFYDPFYDCNMDNAVNITDVTVLINYLSWQ